MCRFAMSTVPESSLACERPALALLLIVCTCAGHQPGDAAEVQHADTLLLPDGVHCTIGQQW